jgi:hypothetical protein
MPDEERIRRRAHEIWEADGRPEGRHEEHWARARREVEEEGAGGSPPEPARPDARPTDTASGSAGPERARGGGAPPQDVGESEAARIID